jgi:hypothetical protein
MTTHEAAKIIEVTPNSKPRQIDAAYNALRHKYVARAQYSTVPSERDEANRALGLVQDAYRTLTGRPAPTRIKPMRAARTAPSSSIPRASLGGKRTRHGRSSSAARSRTHPHGGVTNPSRSRKTTNKSPWTSAENTVAFAFTVAIFVLALTALACVWSYAS